MANSTQVTPNLVDTGLNLLFKGDPVPTVRSFGNIFFVNSVGGVDATGQKGRFDKPFATIQAAVSQALMGDVVFVYPGTYTENITSAVSQAVHLVGYGVMINGNVNLNTNAGGGYLCLYMGSKVNGNILGTFGARVVSDGSGEVNGNIGTGDNGGHYVRGLYKWTIPAMNFLGPNYLVEDVSQIVAQGQYGFQTTDASSNNSYKSPVFRRIGSIDHTYSTDTTGALFRHLNGVWLDEMSHISKVRSASGALVLSTGRDFEVKDCFNVSFLEAQPSDVGFWKGTFRNCRFKSTGGRLATAFQAAAQFRNCDFQVTGTEVFNLTAAGATYAFSYLDYLQCFFNTSNFFAGNAPNNVPKVAGSAFYSDFTINLS